MRRLNRRVFFKTTGLSVGTAALFYRCHEPVETWNFLSDREVGVLEAMLEQIIPSDEDPGAREAGVIYFIDRQLVGPYERFQSIYREGLASVEATSRSLFDRSFSGLNSDDQVSLLHRLEKDEAGQEFRKSRQASSFFQMVVDHAMQGFYGSPIHGGNKDFLSHEMLGIELPIDYRRPRS